MPRGWSRLRAQVLLEEPRCRSCGGPSTEVDHVLARANGGTDDRANLAALCSACHAAKTVRDRTDARRRKRAAR
ncbi:MAG TPA: HNH endonuclease signature motif containing protein [Actinomycetota bacterium]|nr:HNH endonuclease signature motif containing protein [Actinomycetota bacterium]